MEQRINVSCTNVCGETPPNKKDNTNLGAYPSFPASFGGMSLAADNNGRFVFPVDPEVQPFNTMAVCVPFTAENIWGNVMSAPAQLIAYDLTADSSLVFPSNLTTEDPYVTGTSIFRPMYTGIYHFNVAAVIFAYYATEQVGHFFDVHWALVKSDVGTIKNITNISALGAEQLLPLAHHEGLSDSEIPCILHTSQLIKIGKYEEVALFAYFTSDDTNIVGQINVSVLDAPGESVTPAHLQFVRVG